MAIHRQPRRPAQGAAAWDLLALPVGIVALNVGLSVASLVSWRGRWRRIGVVLLLGLALTVAACGTSTSGGGGPAPTTVKPTATPVPCSTWRIMPSPNATQYQTNVLSSVSALSPTAAWGVGDNYAEGGGPVTSLIEQWDGTSWHVIPNPGSNFLNGVAAMSPNDVWAVGGTLNLGGANRPIGTLIEHWNGSQWAVMPTPTGDSIPAELVSAAANAANDVWAVGRQFEYVHHTTLPLIERWDGSAWYVVTSPALSGTANSGLTAITRIPGTQQLLAVGAASSSSGPGYTQALIERWDGSAWHVVTGPALPSGAFGSALLSVVAHSPTDAWAVGNYIASNHTIRTLIAHWNGTAWQVVASPDTWGSLASVAAAGPRDMRAVGYVTSGDSNTQHLLIEQWDGTAWCVAPTPEPGVAS